MAMTDRRAEFTDAFSRSKLLSTTLAAHASTACRKVGPALAERTPWQCAQKLRTACCGSRRSQPDCK